MVRPTSLMDCERLFAVTTMSATPVRVSSVAPWGVDCASAGASEVPAISAADKAIKP